jgi:predicted transcriptional regulator
MAEDMNASSTLELATELTIAWLSNPNTRAPAEEVPAFLQKMHEAVADLLSGGSEEQQSPPEQEFTPAVTARRSLSSKDHIISMIDGKPYKSLKRHLARHGLTPDQYRQRYGLKSDYPMVSESYSQVRRDMAKKIGLGRKSAATTAAPAQSDASDASDGSTAQAPAKQTPAKQSRAKRAPAKQSAAKPAKNGRRKADNSANSTSSES